MSGFPASALATLPQSVEELGGRPVVEEWLQSFSAADLQLMQSNLQSVMDSRQVSSAAKRPGHTSPHDWDLIDRGYRIRAIALGLRQVSTAWRDDDVRDALNPIQAAAQTTYKPLERKDQMDQVDWLAIQPKRVELLKQLDNALYDFQCSSALQDGFDNGECTAMHWVLGDEVHTTLGEVVSTEQGVAA